MRGTRVRSVSIKSRRQIRLGSELGIREYVLHKNDRSRWLGQEKVNHVAGGSSSVW